MSLLNLPDRTVAPRQTGLTMVNDIGIGLSHARDLVNTYGSLMDFVKFGVGTAYVMPHLEEKISIFQEAGIRVYFGGTLFEKFYAQNKLGEYLKYLEKLNIRHIEISNGTIELPLEDRISLTKEIKSDFHVLAEVGCKDQSTIMPPSQWINEINSLIDAGAEQVITEGRDSGTAGIFRTSGEIRTGLISDIVSSCNSEQLIFETPTYSAQMFLINLLGVNVNLGNIRPDDVLILEAERLGLRSETFSGAERIG